MSTAFRGATLIRGEALIRGRRLFQCRYPKVQQLLEGVAYLKPGTSYRKYGVFRKFLLPKINGILVP